MTKITILGDESKQEKKLKPIEFVKALRTNSHSDTIRDNETPEKWDNIILLKKKASDDLDLMYAWDNDKYSFFIILGHFNDGIVE